MKSILNQLLSFFQTFIKRWTFSKRESLLILSNLIFLVLWVSAPQSGVKLATTTALSQVAEDWTCSMHPFIHLPHAGKCPICSMDLILSMTPNSSSKLGAAPQSFKLSEEARKLSKISSTPVRLGKAAREIHLVGSLALIPGREKRISALAGGRISKVWVSSVGAFVRQGEVLFEIEKNNGETSALAVEQVRAPMTGAILGIFFRSGEMVEEGRELYAIVDLGSLRADLDVYEKDLSLLASGLAMELEFSALPGVRVQSSILSVDVALDSQTRLGKAKAEIANPQFLFRPGMSVRAKVLSPAGDQVLLIPRTAVLTSGTRTLIYLEHFDESQNRYVYEGKEVTIGNIFQNEVEVLSGLKVGEVVLSRGAFAVDAAMQLQGNESLMNRSEMEMKSEQK
jgi:Cu(I)/Ag(I) efflux system membrane fusion protein